MKNKKLIIFLLVVSLVSFLSYYLVFAWDDPGSSPPNSNVEAPVNVGPLNQIKEGGLSVGSFVSRFGTILALDSGNVAIGVTTTSAKLEVAGQVKITGGSPGTGKILTSDANGLASWQEPATGGSGGNTPLGGVIMYSGAWNFDSTGLGTGDLLGWALCNGNNGTPDLSSRFVMGTANAAALETSGGSNSYALTTAQLPSHNHSFTTNSAGSHSHSISIGSAGGHSHSISGGGKSVYAYGTPYYCSSGYGLNCFSGGPRYFAGHSSYPSQASASYVGSHSHSASVGTSGWHSHSGTTNNTGSGNSIDNRPAYINLAFIMKI